MADITLAVVEEQPITLKYVEAAIKPEQVGHATPTYESQTVYPDPGCVFSQVEVAAISDPTEQLNITENDDYNVARIGTVHVNVPQGVFPTGTKEITANGTGIDVEQYAAVDVNVPQGVFPSGTKQITENGTGIDVTEYAAVDVAVPGIVPSGTKQISVTQNGTTTHDVTQYASAEIVTNVNTDPEKGLVFGDYDADGFPTTARLVGEYNEIPAQYFAATFNTVSNGTKFGSKIKSIHIPHGVTTINLSAFFQCNSLTEILLPNTLTTICGTNTFYSVVADIIIPSSFTTWVSNQQFVNYSGKKIIFEGNCPSIPNSCFAGATYVELYDFSHCIAIPSLYSVASLGHKSGCVIKIPSALSDITLGTGNGWESATNWVNLTNIVWEVV